MIDSVDQPLKLAEKKVPAHFGYDSNTTLGETFKQTFVVNSISSFQYQDIPYGIQNTGIIANLQSAYMITNGHDRMIEMIYTENIRERDDIYKLTGNDFEKLNSDQTVTKTYSCGEVEIWTVRVN